MTERQAWAGCLLHRVCGRVFYAARPQARYCDSRCRNHAYIERRRLRVAERQRVCPSCGTVFQAARSDAVYCSSACRQTEGAWRLPVVDV